MYRRILDGVNLRQIFLAKETYCIGRDNRSGRASASVSFLFQRQDALQKCILERERRESGTQKKEWDDNIIDR